MLRLTELRLRRGWPKAELARRAKLDQANLSRIEAGRATPYPVELRRLATALGFATEDPARLLDEVSDPHFGPERMS
jgi:transcriptional regulator with XRE-family HTH domain